MMPLTRVNLLAVAGVEENNRARGSFVRLGDVNFV
jgi:hypothetical protein